MNQDKSIIDRTHVQTNVVVVNQCDKEHIEEWDFTNASGEICHAKFISTKERGLSRSRNMAIRNANGEICLICDDDEELLDGYDTILKKAYKDREHADVITFAFDRKDKQFSNTPQKHTIKTLLKTSSVEITFLLKSVKDRNIFFDEKMGSGTGNGPGEENMFMFTCKRKGLQMYYEPIKIGKLLSTDSAWFDGYTKRYFENFGWANRRIQGPYTSLVYLTYWMVRHRNLYIDEISTLQAVKSCLKGWGSKR